MNVTWRQGGTYKPLTGEAKQKIHETSLRVFEEVGIEVRLPEARRLFLGAGAKPGEREDVLTIPPEMVEKLVNAGAAQMAQYYKLPYYATAGMTDAKVSEAQAGYESAVTNTNVTSLNWPTSDIGRNGLQPVRRIYGRRPPKRCGACWRSPLLCTFRETKRNG